MSYLWDLSAIRPQTEVVMPGDTIPAIFWNAVQQRGPDIWLRQKEFGIWRSWTWTQVGQAVREIGHGLLAIGFDARETASILSNTNVEWVLCDIAVLSANGVSNGIYPTDAAEQVQFGLLLDRLDQDLEGFAPVVVAEVRQAGVRNRGLDEPRPGRGRYPAAAA